MPASSPFLRPGLTLIELPIAFGLFYVFFKGGTWLGCRIHPCYDVQGIGVLVIVFPAAVVVALAYWIVMGWRDMPLRRRLIWDGAAALLGIVVYAVPQIMAMSAEAQARAREQREVEWYEALKRGAHAPPGVAPPMFDVVEEGTSAVVTNKGPKRHFIALARVVPDGTRRSGWQSCAMPALNVGGFEFHMVFPGESARFVLDPRCANAFAGAAIEYRVDSDPPEWWSDSAIATHEDRPFPPAR